MAVRITQTRIADENNVVHTVEGGGGNYRRHPCPGCPWRVENAGSFPAEAFRHSANTSYDCSMHTFACHESGMAKPAVCAGFLLRNSAHNIGARIMAMRGAIDFDQVSDGGAELFESYREMAIANGVGPDERVLARCRGDRE